MRVPMLICATGLQGVGKSHETLKQAIYQAYVAPPNTRRSALIYDVNNEYSKYEIDGVMHYIKPILPNQIIAFGNQPQTEVRRIVPFHPNGQPMGPEDTEKLLIQVMSQYRNGTLIIEDLNRIYADALPVSVSGMFVNVRHRNCDCVYHMQSVGRLLPKMRQNTRIVRFHYQLDSIASSKDKLAGVAKIFTKAEKLVQKQYDSGNIRFFVYIYRETKKIKGLFSPRMFADAIKEYLYENPKETQIIERRRDNNGKKMYTYQEAILLRLDEMFKKYYGNE